MIKHLSNIRFS